MAEDTLLAVENNPLIARAIEKAGERLHLKVDVALDGWDAIEKLRDGHYAAVVIDSEVPRRSGFGVITYLRQESGEPLTRVVLLAHADETLVRRSSSEGFRVIARDGSVDEITTAIGCCVAQTEAAASPSETTPAGSSTPEPRW